METTGIAIYPCCTRQEVTNIHKRQQQDCHIPSLTFQSTRSSMYVLRSAEVSTPAMVPTHKPAIPISYLKARMAADVIPTSQNPTRLLTSSHAW
jgi:hypothetical protein